MDFQTSVKTCLLQKYVDFSGRASRSEYWWFVLFTMVVYMVVAVVLGDFLGVLVNLALLLPSLAAGARRLHDMGKSGWFQLVWLIPFVGWIIMIYWLVQPSAGPNEYGQGPFQPAVPQLPPGSA